MAISFTTKWYKGTTNHASNALSHSPVGEPRIAEILAEQDENGQPRSPCFDRFESFGHDDLTAKRCYFRCSRLPHVDRIKMLDKDDQATKH